MRQQVGYYLLRGNKNNPLKNKKWKIFLEKKENDLFTILLEDYKDRLFAFTILYPELRFWTDFNRTKFHDEVSERLYKVIERKLNYNLTKDNSLKDISYCRYEQIQSNEIIPLIQELFNTLKLRKYASIKYSLDYERINKLRMVADI